MYCPLEQIHLTVETCPITRCIYRDQQGQCQHKRLTQRTGDGTTEGVTAETIADVKGQKLYKVKVDSQSGKHNLSVGLIIDKYVDYVINSFPSQPVNKEVPDNEQPVAFVLRKIFCLTVDQQRMFWSKVRFDEWCSRQRVGMEISLTEVYQVLKEISPA